MWYARSRRFARRSLGFDLSREGCRQTELLADGGEFDGGLTGFADPFDDDGLG